MTQITRETAIALAKEAGMAGMLTDVVCSLEEIHRLCNLAVAHDQARRKQQFVGFMHAMNSSQQPENRSTEELNCPHCGGSGHVDDVAHSRKDAEPVAKLTFEAAWAEMEKRGYRYGRDALAGVKFGWKLHEDWNTTNPPEADKLLQQALEALEYRLQQTRPIHQADVVMESIRTYLEIKNA